MRRGYKETRKRRQNRRRRKEEEELEGRSRKLRRMSKRRKIKERVYGEKKRGEEVEDKSKSTIAKQTQNDFRFFASKLYCVIYILNTLYSSHNPHSAPCEKKRINEKRVVLREEHRHEIKQN